MSKGTIGTPGAKFGPCLECKHRDCQALRRDAEAVCHFCDKPIGYGAGFYSDPETQGQLVHAVCLEDHVDKLVKAAAP